MRGRDRFSASRLLPWVLMAIILILLVALFYPRGGGGKHVTTNPTPTQAPQKIDAQLGAWIYPDSPGKPACSAPKEYSDGRQVNVLNVEYLHLENAGTLTQISADTQCNGYSQANAADIKAHSQEQYITISGGAAGLAALSSNAALQTDFINTALGLLHTTNFTGLELDIEEFAQWTPGQYSGYLAFITTLGNTLHQAGYKLQVDGPVIFNNTYQGYYKQWKWGDFEHLPVDRVTVLCYDLMNDNGAGTPITPLSTISACCTWMKSNISDPNRIVVGLPNYGYSGPAGSYTPLKATYQEAQKFPGVSSLARRNPASGEMIWAMNGVAYDYSDSTTMNLRLQTVLACGLKNVSVWSLGGLGPWFSPPSKPVTHDPPPLTAPEVVALLSTAYPGWDAWYRQYFDAEGNYLG